MMRIMQRLAIMAVTFGLIPAVADAGWCCRAIRVSPCCCCDSAYGSAFVAAPPIAVAVPAPQYYTPAISPSCGCGIGGAGMMAPPYGMQPNPFVMQPVPNFGMPRTTNYTLTPIPRHPDIVW